MKGRSNGKIYCVLSIVYEKGLRPAEEMRDGKENVKPHSPAEDVIWWKMMIIINQ